jgi:hypothetical protein
MTSVFNTFRKRGCDGAARMPKATFIAMLSEGSITHNFFLGLDDDQWRITSFNPDSREVCVDVITPQGLVNKLAVTINFLAPTMQQEPASTETNNAEIPTVVNTVVQFANLTEAF